MPAAMANPTEPSATQMTGKRRFEDVGAGCAASFFCECSRFTLHMAVLIQMASFQMNKHRKLPQRSMGVPYLKRGF